tara:strand:- start:3117 stop:3560 length:444 start_codon:yes stop_codon:yes gene_type:complete
MKVLLINGPNLNLLGFREPEIYGNYSLNDLEKELEKKSSQLGISLICFQSNSEGEIINQIHNAISDFDSIIINAGGLTHTSVSIRDALIGSQLPFIEIHISNIFAREEYRHKSYLTDKAIGIISGFGVYGYELALLGIVKYFELKNR